MVARRSPFPGQMREEDQPRLVGQAQLLHGPDRHLMVAEDLGHRGQDTGPIGHVHAEVEGRPSSGWGRTAMLVRLGAGPGAPARRFRAASTRSPSTALAVGPPPAPRP